ncbi:hypothetical protein [Arthrobacter sp. 131MFCol6.1]|uniref:hypothetical protein n=1 Tax=Arthrobacter sp. 131MFCol6.1 TaxID=1157944 RepID=UPI00039C30D8|nr:hypothetical protein [Arthrobacter sp. 131MFCol6.1]
MSTEYPHPGYSAIAAETEDAKRSRKGRTGIGIGLLAVGALAAFGMVWLYTQYGPLIGTLSESERAEVVIFDALNVLFILALLVGGIWNISARRSKSLAPPIAALALSGIGLALAITNLLDTLNTVGMRPNFVAFFLYLGILVQTIRLIRGR